MITLGRHSIVIGRPGVRLSGGGGGAQPQPFVGPYDDIPGITAAYGMRRLLTAYTGDILRLRRSSDNAESDFGYTANGDLDTAAIAAWLGEDDGYVVTWYDQSGNGNDAAQSTAASQPLYVASGQNGLPVLRFDGSDDGLSIANTAWGDTMSILVVLQQAETPINQTVLDAATAFSFVASAGIRFDRVVGNYRLGIATGTSAGSFNQMAAVDTAWHVRQGHYDGAEISQTIDGVAGVPTAKTGDIDYTDVTDTKIGIFYDGASNPLGGDMAELIIANNAWSTTDRQAAESAANDYWEVY